MNIFNEEDDFMVTTPRENYFSISRHANENIVEMEFEKVLERLAVAEKLIEEKGLEGEFDLLYSQMRAVDKMDLEDLVNGLFLELAGNIVTQCE